MVSSTKPSHFRTNITVLLKYFQFTGRKPQNDEATRHACPNNNRTFNILLQKVWDFQSILKNEIDIWTGQVLT